MFCPADCKPCPDDLCRGGGCLKTGTAMLEKCLGCGALICPDEGDTDACTCPPSDPFDDYDD